MKEKANLSVRQLLTNHLRHKTKVVIVHPDDVATLVVLDNCVSERLVYLDVKHPRVIEESFTLGVVGNNIVEDRPKNGLAKVCIVAIEILVAGKDSQSVMFLFQLVVNLHLLVLVDAVGREADQTNREHVFQAILVHSRTNSIGQATISLNSRHNCIVRCPPRICGFLLGIRQVLLTLCDDLRPFLCLRVLENCVRGSWISSRLGLVEEEATAAPLGNVGVATH